MAKSTMFLRSFLLLLAILSSGARIEAQLLPPLPVPPIPIPLPASILGKLDPLLQQRVPSFTGRSKVIVRATSLTSIGPVRLLVQQLGGVLGRQLPLIEGFVADVPNISLPLLANSSLVKRVALDRLILGATERTGATVGATAVRQATGYDGSGVGVAVIDSGIALWHDDLSQNGLGSQRVDQFVDFVNGRTTPYDDYGHGTHVAGIVAGDGFDSNGARSGIAPRSRLIALKVLDQAGRGRISNVIAALDYVVAHQDDLNIRIANLSVAAGVFESYHTDLLTLAARKAVERGIVVVAAAGNAGRDSQGRNQYGGITAPGNAPWVLTVGASSHMGTVDRADDTVAAFSSRGPTAIDRAAKPDLVAPGVGIESLSAPGSALFASKSPYLLNGSSPSAYPPLSQPERYQPGDAGCGRHGGTDAPGQSGPDAQRRQSGAAVHGGEVRRLSLVFAGRRIPQHARRRRARTFSCGGARRSIPGNGRMEPAADLGQSTRARRPADGHGQRVGNDRRLGDRDDTWRADTHVGCVVRVGRLRGRRDE